MIPITLGRNMINSLSYKAFRSEVKKMIPKFAFKQVIIKNLKTA